MDYSALTGALCPWTEFARNRRIVYAMYLSKFSDSTEFFESKSVSDREREREIARSTWKWPIYNNNNNNNETFYQAYRIRFIQLYLRTFLLTRTLRTFTRFSAYVGIMHHYSKGLLVLLRSHKYNNGTNSVALRTHTFLLHSRSQFPWLILPLKSGKIIAYRDKLNRWINNSKLKSF